jgi:3-hydroxyisobutyrate dehydrogenase-like beta-hydroxyacid dehydrogenase
VLTGGRPRLVGFVGLGNMGRRTAANLAAAGFAADHSEAHKQWWPIDLAAEDP